MRQVLDTHRKFRKKSSMLFCLLVSMKEPDEICYTRYRDIREENSFFESIQKKSTIASGATTNGAAGRAPDDIMK
jgi:hypothetical protein